MQVCFDLIITQDDFDIIIKPLETYFELGGDKISYEPQKFTYENNI